MRFWSITGRLRRSEITEIKIDKHEMLFAMKMYMAVRGYEINVKTTHIERNRLVGMTFNDVRRVNYTIDSVVNAIRNR